MSRLCRAFLSVFNLKYRWILQLVLQYCDQGTGSGLEKDARGLSTVVFLLGYESKPYLNNITLDQTDNATEIQRVQGRDLGHFGLTF